MSRVKLEWDYTRIQPILFYFQFHIKTSTQLKRFIYGDLMHDLKLMTAQNVGTTLHKLCPVFFRHVKDNDEKRNAS
jgi:hypothetical protein